jgi:chromosome segregation ATPase
VKTIIYSEEYNSLLAENEIQTKSKNETDNLLRENSQNIDKINSKINELEEIIHKNNPNLKTLENAYYQISNLSEKFNSLIMLSNERKKSLLNSNIALFEDGDIQNVNSNISSLKKQIEDILSEIESATKVYNSQNDVYLMTETKINDLQSDILNSAKVQRENSEKTEELKNKLSNAISTIEFSTTQVEELTKKIDASKNFLEKLQSELNGFDSEIVELEEDVADATNQESSKSTDLNSKKSKLANDVDALSTAQTELAKSETLLTQYLSLKTEIDEIKDRKKGHIGTVHNFSVSETEPKDKAFISVNSTISINTTSGKPVKYLIMTPEKTDENIEKEILITESNIEKETANIESFKKHISELTKSNKLLESEIELIQKELDIVTDKKQKSSTELAVLNNNKESSDKEFKKLTNEINELTSQISKYNNEISNATTNKDLFKKEIDEMSKNIGYDSSENSEKILNDLKVDLTDQKELKDKSFTSLNELQNNLSGLEFQLKEFESKKNNIEKQNDQVERINKIRSESAKRASEILKVVESKKNQIDELKQKIIEARTALDANVNKHNGEIIELRKILSTVHSKTSNYQNDQHNFVLQLQRIGDKLEYLETQIINDLGCTGAELEGLVQELNDDPNFSAFENLEGARKYLDQLNHELKMLGSINPLALEEFEEAKIAFDENNLQLSDITSSRDKLHAMLEDIDKQMIEEFHSAFKDTAKEFEKIFPILFPGGKGKLYLTDPNDLLLTGIEVEASPKGKRIKKLSLLSGGEKSLVAFAILVAIFKARPSPFYVFDEIEAALDDFNLTRLLTVINDLKQNSQLIIVTHQKRTMEIANVVYGIAMQGDGVSQVISAKLDDLKI